MFQQMGFGVAVALAIDATLVRTVLLPAAMKLLGDWNWYLPSWLEWLPHVGVEGPPPSPSAHPRRRLAAHAPEKERGPHEGGPDPVTSAEVVEALPAGLLGPAARNAESPTLARRFPVGPGDTPLPAGTSTARTGICHVRTTSFPR